MDCNAIDPLVDTAGAVETLVRAREQGCIDLMYPHITLEEVLATPDVGRRALLAGALKRIGRQAPSGAFVLGFSRLGEARFSDSENFERLRSMQPGDQPNLMHTRDALIASTAQYERCTLVTNERRLTNRARAEGIEVVTSRQLLALVGMR